MDTKIPDQWKDLKLEFDDLKNYKTYKELINDHDEHYNKPEKNTGSKKISYANTGKCNMGKCKLPKAKLPKAKCSIQ